MTRRPSREAALTDVGRIRDHNEDNMGVLLSENLYIVADGMGGHAAGEVASQIAVDAVIDFFKLSKAKEEDEGADGGDCDDNCRERTRLETAIELANLKIYEEGAQQANQRGMGTTVVALHLHNSIAHLAHVGDSRIYRLRAGELEQVTTDHSWFAEVMANAKDLDPEMIAHAERYKNVITRALGMSETVEVDLRDEKIEPGDLYLLCSDGLHDMLPDETILRLLCEHRTDLPLCCERLIEAANEAGGMDNITVLLVDTDTILEKGGLADAPTVAAEEE